METPFLQAHPSRTLLQRHCLMGGAHGQGKGQFCLDNGCFFSPETLFLLAQHPKNGNHRPSSTFWATYVNSCDLGQPFSLKNSLPPYINEKKNGAFCMVSAKQNRQENKVSDIEPHTRCLTKYQLFILQNAARGQPFKGSFSHHHSQFPSSRDPTMASFVLFLQRLLASNLFLTPCETYLFAFSVCSLNCEILQDKDAHSFDNLSALHSPCPKVYLNYNF